MENSFDSNTFVPVDTVRLTIMDTMYVVSFSNYTGTGSYIALTVPPAEIIDSKKKNKQAQGVYVNIPGKLRSTISDAQGIVNTAEFPAGQFGNVELLSGALFNKRYTTRLWLHPLSGAVEKIDVEQSK